MSAMTLRAVAEAADALAGEAKELARLARAAAESPADTTALMPIAEAAVHAGTSERTLREAIRAGTLPAYGRQRDRAIRRGNLDGWIESRRVRPLAGADDADIARRMRRLQRQRGPNDSRGRDA